MTQHILLFRHGETEFGTGEVCCGSTDCLLSEDGKRQSLTNIAYAVQNGVERVVTSKKKRTRLAGIHLQKHNKVPHEVHPGLNEYDFGPHWEKQRWSVIARDHAEDFDRFRKKPFGHQIPGAESIEDFEQRVTRTWSEIVERVQKERIEMLAVFGHGMVNARILQTIDGQNWHPNDQPLWCMNEIVLSGGKAWIEQVGVVLPQCNA